MTNKPDRDGKIWSRDESILAFDLYCRIPFSKTKANNPVVIALSTVLHRTPASVARKLGNFGAFDPELKKRLITGLTHTSKLDEVIWDEFHSDWGRLVLEAERIRREVMGKSSTELESLIPEEVGPTEREAKVKQRIHQDFFRASVLAGHNYRCCICGLPYPEILVASHIIPWSAREDTRVNPENGLCLCAIHDRAFDRGLISVDAGFSIKLCGKLKESTHPASLAMFGAYSEKHIVLPERFIPNGAFLQWHIDNIFSG
jgi:putative restriction endonuclease